MNKGQLEFKVIKKLEKEKEFIEKEKNKFIGNFLRNAAPEFEKYGKGYKIFSVTTGKTTYFSLDDKMVTRIANRLVKLYACKLLSASQTYLPQTDSSINYLPPKLYTLTFKK